MSTAWDLSTLSHTTAATGVSTQETGFRGICFSPDGLNMYYTGPSSDKIHRYTLSTAWDITTLSHDSSTTSTVDGFPSGLFIKEDGTRLYVVGLTGDKVYQFNPSTAYTLSGVLTSSTDIDSEFSIATEDTSPTCLYISPDGDHMYVGGGIGNGIDQYSLPGSTTAPSLTDAASSLTSSKTDL
jgi:sugar lactone lactonase YvrE